MDIRIQTLEPECYYHIYNRGINSDKIFENVDNYLFFLKQFSKYVMPVCDVYAYCLMPNHFHFALKIKSKEELLLFARNELKLTKVNSEGLHAIQNVVSKQISKFISSYGQSYNKAHSRHGALLESPFKRKKIDSEEYLRNLILYIHQNPTDLKRDFKTYKFSSYAAMLSNAKTNLRRTEVIELFDDLDNFIFYHNNPFESFDFWK
jgi:putative transposase